MEKQTDQNHHWFKFFYVVHIKRTIRKRKEGQKGGRERVRGLKKEGKNSRKGNQEEAMGRKSKGRRREEKKEKD